MGVSSFDIVSLGSPEHAFLADISANGLFVSYIDTPDTTDGTENKVLNVRNLTDDSLATVASFPVGVNLLAGAFSGVDGGALSADGRYIFYSTGITDGNFAGTVTGVPILNITTHIFVKDLQFPASPPVDVTPFFDPRIGGFPNFPTQATAFQGLLPVEISDDGRQVLYGRNFQDFVASIALDGVFTFAPGPPSLRTAVIPEVNESAQIFDPTLEVTPLDFSADGRFVLFESDIPLLGEGNPFRHVYFIDLQNGILKSVGGTGTFARSSDNAMSANGEFIAYDKQLVTSGSINQVYVQHRVGDSVTDTLVSESADGTDGNGNSFVTSISGDGNFVAFISSATNLVSNDTNGVADLFVKNLQTGEIIRVSAGTLDGELSFDGTRIAFTTAQNFIAAGGPGIDDLDGLLDVYVATLDWNDPPKAVSDSYTTNEDTALNIVAPGVLANDTDADSDSLTAVLVSGPSHGSLTLNLNGSFDYTPDANYNGPDSFTYKANDGTLDSATTTVSIGITAVNDAPTGAADSASVLEDAFVSIAVIANDSDVDGDTLTLTSLSGTKSTLGASIAIVSGEVLYTADADIFDVATFTGATDTFTYIASDPGGLNTSPVTVEVTVSPVSSDNQTLFGTARPDAFTDRPGFDTTYFASNGNDVVSGLDGSDVLHGENGNDQLSGGAGIDFLYGERGNDILDGGDGNDELDGGPGDDQLTGGNGSDTFIFTKIAGSVDAGDDTILDFGVGVDHLQLNGLTVNSLTSADVDHTGELDAVLSFNEGGSVTLLGVGVISDWHALL